ncbi:MAG: methyl-accepting chemotaxis protein [Lentisphaeria bacterium]
MKIQVRIAVSGVACVLATVAVLLLLVIWQNTRYQARAQAELEDLVRADLDRTVMGAYHLIEAENETLQAQIDHNLKVAHRILADAGGVVNAPERVTWPEAQNQLTQATLTVQLPKLLVGGKWLGQNADPAVATAVVDDVQQLVGGTATLFQRMNPAGDMLRVATNVENQGRRAIGTYIPALMPDGKPNPVISSVLKGETYRGRAFVANSWSITAYEPLRDAAGQVIGMLYVGSRPEQGEALRNAIRKIRIGKTGYAYVLGGSGEQRGQYILSPGGTRDGENVWELQAADGRRFIQELISQCLLLHPGELATVRYPWKTAGEAGSRMKFVRGAYYAPCDWVIVAGCFEDEMSASRLVLEAGQRRMLWGMGLVGVVVALAAGLLFVWLARALTAPVRGLVAAAGRLAQGDLRQPVAYQGADEMGLLAGAFRQMVDGLRRITLQVHEATANITTATHQISAATSEQAATADTQAAAVAQTTATAAEVQQTSAQAADRIRLVSEMAAGSLELAERGLVSVKEMEDAMDVLKKQVRDIAELILRLSGQTQQIGEIIAAVTDLADQSNVLAVNASIEAVRAGEAGRGFAVVAGEVRSLAEQSRQATRQIGGILGEIQKMANQAVLVTEQGSQRTEAGVGLALATGEAIRLIRERVQQVATAARQIAISADQQRIGVEQIATAMASINHGAAQSQTVTRQVEEAALDLDRQAVTLRKVVSAYKVE